jgi:hypothetical protein
MRARSVLILVLGLIFLAGCSAAGGNDLPVPVVQTTNEVPTTTATIQWFPATATPTPRAVEEVTPTLDPRPSIGTLKVEDNFSKTDLWQVNRSDAGTVAYGKNELTLAISKVRGRLYSFRQDILVKDFYMEISVNPSLCRGQDAYGILFRVKNSGSFYRFLVNCSGQFKIERVSGNTPSVLRDWTRLGQVQVGSMGKIKIGIWARGSELRVFVDDVYQYQATDAAFLEGWLGVFAVSSSDTPVTVNFSDLKVWALDGTAAIETLSPSITPTIKN